MSGDRSGRSTLRLYVCLALLFALAVGTQILFLKDLIRDLAQGYSARPFELSQPWPTITRVQENATAAGLQGGDRVVSMAARVPTGFKDLAVMVRNTRPGQYLDITVERQGQRSEHRLMLIPNRGPLDPFVMFFTGLIWFFMPALCILLGFWVVALRPTDARAWLVLGVLLGLSQIILPLNLDPSGWPDLTRIAGIGYRTLVVTTWPIWMTLFGIYFPHRWGLDCRLPFLKWILIIPLVLKAIIDTIAAIGYSESYAGTASLLSSVPPSRSTGQALLFPAIAVFFGGLLGKYRDPSIAADDRRRLRLTFTGCAVSLGPALLLLLDWLLLDRTARQDGMLLVLVMMPAVLFPLTLAYVIVVERALDVRMVIRQGVQYALARGGIGTLQALATVGILLGAATLAAGRAGVNFPVTVAVVAVCAAILLVRNRAERLRHWVDRRFFREAYDAERILGELTEQVRSIFEISKIVETVAGRISDSLHVTHVAVLLRNGASFQPALASGYQGPPEARFPLHSGIITSLRHSREPVRVDHLQEGSGLDAIAAQERETLAALRAEILLPLSSKDELLGFISLGPKRSEQPYSPSDVRLLRTVAAQTGLAIENSLLTTAIATETAERQMMVREVEIAREVQQRLFPQGTPTIAGLDYAGHCRPALGVGGDYYDFLQISETMFGFAIADISGKGIAAALLMASLQASVRGRSQSGTDDVAALMTSVNQLVHDVSPSNRYATFFYSVYTPETRKLVYVNGGHNPPVVLRNGEAMLLKTGGPVVGLFRHAAYQKGEVQLQPGDMLVLYTDGVSESMNAQDEEWGEDALIEAAQRCRGTPAKDVINHLMNEADAFAAGAPQHDDMTLVIVRVL